MKLKVLDAGFLPGRVFLAENYLPEDRESLKIEMQKASSRVLAFDDNKFVLNPELCGACHRIEDSGLVAVLMSPTLIGTERLLTLIHEMLHAACEVLRYSEVRPCKKSEEIYAYLQEHLLRQTGEF